MDECIEDADWTYSRGREMSGLWQTSARVMESMVHLSYAASYGKYHTVRERTELIDTETLPSKESEPTVNEEGWLGFRRCRAG